MANYYVSNSGNDGNSGAIGAPWLTLAYAVAQLAPSDFLYLRLGIFAGSSNAIDSQTNTVPSGSDWTTGAITIKAFAGEAVTIRTPHNVSPLRIAGSAVSFLIFEDITFDGGNSGTGADADSVYLDLADHIRFNRCEVVYSYNFGIHSSENSEFLEILECDIHDNGHVGGGGTNGHGLYLTGSDALIEDCDIYDNRGYGVHVYSTGDLTHATPSRVITRKNRIHGNGANDASTFGVVVAWGSDNEVYNNLLYDGLGGGILVYTDATDALVYYNTVYNHVGDGIALQYYANAPNVRGNIVFDNGGDIEDYGGTGTPTISGNLLTDPDFTDAGAGDFTLQAGSDAIDAGPTIGSITDDFNGGARPQGAAYDIGALEFGAGGGGGGGLFTEDWSDGFTEWPAPSPIPSTYGIRSGIGCGGGRSFTCSYGLSGPTDPIAAVVRLVATQASPLLSGSLRSQIGIFSNQSGTEYLLLVIANFFDDPLATGTAGNFLALLSVTSAGRVRVRIPVEFVNGAFHIFETADGIVPVNGTVHGYQLSWNFPAHHTVEIKVAVDNVLVIDDDFTTDAGEPEGFRYWGYYDDPSGPTGYNEQGGVNTVGVLVIRDPITGPANTLVANHGVEVDDDPAIITYAACSASALSATVCSTSLPVPGPLPSAPLTPCTPQTPVGNGGRGAAGCNTGGVGWTPSYAGPYGTVPDHDDPPADETLTGREHVSVEVWAEIDHEHYPAQSPSIEMHRIAMTGLAHDPDFEGGYKREGLLAVGDIVNAFGHEQGGPEAARVNIAISQIPDRQLLDLLADEELDGDELRIKLATDELGASPGGSPAVTAMVLARSVIEEARLESGPTLVISAVDQLYAADGPLGPKRRVPSWKFKDIEAIAAVAPSDTLELDIPICYGEKSDEGAVDPVTLDPNPKGLVPGIFAGLFTGITGATTQTVYVLADPQPQDPTLGPVFVYGALNFGGGAIDGGVGFIMTAIDASGNETPISSAHGTNENTPGVPRGVAGFFFAHPNAVSYRSYLFQGVNPVWGQSFNPSGTVNGVTRARVMEIVTPDPGLWGATTLADYRVDWTSWDDGVDALALTPVADDDEWGLIVFGLMPFFSFINVYGSDLGEGDPTATRDRTVLDLPNRADIRVPGYLWTGDPYVSFTNTDGREFWLAAIWVRGALLEDHLNGLVNLTANVIGYEHIGDGSGLPIIDAHDVDQHRRENFYLLNKTSGPWCTALTAPRWGDDTPMVNSASFRARQVYTADQYGDRGLTVGWYEDRAKTISQLDREWIESTESRVGWSRHGQMKTFGLDTTVDTTAWPRIFHDRDVFGPWTRIAGQDRENVVAGSCDWDPDAQKFRSVLAPIASDTAIARHKGRRKQADPIESRILNDPLQMSWVLNERLVRLGLGTTLIELAGPREWLDWDIGDGVLFNSLDGPGPTGYVDRPFIIVRRKARFSPLGVVVTLWDIADLLGGSPSGSP